MATTPLAYNPSVSPIPGTTQVGSLAVGTTDQDYSIEPGGVTWWMGPNEESGYVIGVPVSGNTQPTNLSGVTASVGFYRTSGFSDSEFIQLSEIVSNEFGNPQTFLTAQDASNWLTSNGFWNSYGPVVGGLEVYLDAGNSSSYSGSGSVWYDLTNNSNNATLINSPTYSSSYGGIIQFDDASLEYGTIPNIGDLPNWTVEVWFRLSTSLNGKVTSIVSNQYDLSDKLNYSIGTNNAPTNYNLASGFFDTNGWHNTTGISPQTNVWYQFVGTYDGSVVREYVNGLASGGTNNYVGTPQSGGEIRLMRRWDSALQQGNLVDGDLAIVRIYSRALSDSEILINYDFDSSRFVEPTPTPTTTITSTPTQTPTPSITASQTVTPTSTITPTITNTPTTTITPTITNTPTTTPTITNTPTVTRTPTNTPTTTPTPTRPAYTFYRWQITQTKVMPPNADAIQAAEFVFQIGGVDQSMAGVTVTNPSGSNPSGETPSNLVDNNLTTKVVDLNFVSNGNVSNFIFQFSSAKSFNGYRWATANDFEDRDPKSWTIAGSNNGTTWTTLSTVSNFTATVARDTWQTAQTY